MDNDELEMLLAGLESENERLETKAERLESVLDIINLQTRFNLWLELGYYERIWNELFAVNNPDVKCEIWESGVYEGPESVERLWTALAARRRPRGYMANIMVCTPYIQLNSDGDKATGMWWAFGPQADRVTPSPGDQQKLTAYWFFGKYDNEFVKENGKWKYLSLHSIAYIRTPFDKGWFREPDCARWQVPEGASPDKPSTLNQFYHPGIKNKWKPWPKAPHEPIA